MKLNKNRVHVRDSFDGYNDLLEARVMSVIGAQPIFDITGKADIHREYLSEVFLGSIPAQQRQFHNCRQCLNFVKKFAGAVYWTGARWQSLLWEGIGQPHKDYARVDDHMRYAVNLIIGGIYSNTQLSLLELPEKIGHGHTGQFSHFHMHIPRIGQQTAEDVVNAREAYIRMENCGYLSTRLLARAEEVAQLAGLYRADTIKAQLTFLKAYAAAPHGQRHVMSVKAEESLTHPKTTMVGTLLDDILAGKSAPEIKRAFDAKMSPMAYQRATAAVAAQQMQKVEKAFSVGDYAGSLKRRTLELYNIPEAERIFTFAHAPKQEHKSSLFAHVPVKGKVQGKPVMRTGPVSWAVFVRDVLPTAKELHYLVPKAVRLANLTVSSSASGHSPLLKWDTDKRRNTAAWAFGTVDRDPAEWGLRPDEWTPVGTVFKYPPLWHGRKDYTWEGSVFLRLSHSANQEKMHCGLFAESVKTELRDFKRTIELHASSRESRISPPRTGHAGHVSMCRHNLDKKIVTLKVTTALGDQYIYQIDRFE